jgi:tetratricopeptide (TPR) repeat protein
MALAAADHRGAAEAAIGAGNVFEEKGHWGDAEVRYRTALTVLESESGPVPEEWHALLNLHVVLRSSGDIQGSRAPLDRAEAIARDLGDEAAIQFLENARGQSLMASGEFSAAIDRFRTAISASTGARASVTIRLNLAEALLAEGRNLDAAEEARKAEREALAARLGPKLPEVYRILGRVAAADGNPDAFVLFERALDIIRTRELPELELAITLQAYGDAERLVGEPATADELNARADALYQQLGIQRSRSQWADQYGSDQETDGDANRITR